MRHTKRYCEVYNLARRQIGISALLIKQPGNYRLEIINSHKVNEYAKLDTTILKIGSLNEIESFLEGVCYAQTKVC